VPEILIHRILRDGTVVSIVFSAFVIGSFLIEPSMWIDDYPPDIRAALEDAPRASPIFQTVVGGLFLLTLLTLLTRSTRRYVRASSSPGTAGAWLHALLLIQFVNLWDVVVLDWLFFVTIQPDFVVYPGTEGMAGYSDYAFHFQASVLEPGVWAGAIAVSLGVA